VGIGERQQGGSRDGDDHPEAAAPVLLDAVGGKQAPVQVADVHRQFPCRPALALVGEGVYLTQPTRPGLRQLRRFPPPSPSAST